jgi:serine O-acetyltransferase
VSGPDTCRTMGHHTLGAVREGLEGDILRYLNKSPENQAAGDNLRSRLGAFLTPQILCLVLYRVAHWLFVAGYGSLAVVLSRLNQLVHRVMLPPQSCIGPGCFLPHPAGVAFLGRAGRGLTLYALSVCGPSRPWLPGGSVADGPRLGDDVTVGVLAGIAGPVSVGSATKVAFRVNLERDTPAGVMVVSAAMRAARPGRPELPEAPR